MADPIFNPADPSFLDLGLRPKYGTGTASATRLGQVMDTGVPEADQWLRDWQTKNLGRQLDNADRGLIDSISKSFNGRSMFQGPVPTPTEYNLDARPRVLGTIDWDPIKAFKHGFDTSLLGSLQRWMAVDGAAHHDADPKYDPWKDPEIQNGPFRDRPELFEASRSAGQSRSIMRYMQRHEKEASQLEAMSGATGIFELGGAMVGDPLTFLPAALGYRAVRLAERAAMLNAPEQVALGFKPVVWGGIRDGTRSASAQSAVALVEAGLHRYLDPTVDTGSIADIISLPAAIGGSIGFATGAYQRYQNGMHGIERAAANSAFLSATRKSAREAPLSEKEVAYWNKASTANPDGRFHVDGTVQRIEGDNVIFRTAEGIDVPIALRDVDVISEKSARGIAIASAALVRDPALMASAMKLDGAFVGGGRPKLYAEGADVVAPGTLHTDYTAMRADEMARGPLKGTGVVPEAPVARTIPNEDPRGEWTLETVDGRKIHAKDLPVGTKVAAQDGGEFTVVAARGAGEEQSFRRSVYGEQAPTGRRLVDREFKPGELEDVEIAKGGGSLSAGAAGGTVASRRAQLAGNKLVATGLRLEDLPFDVISRAARSPFTTWQTTVEDMLSTSRLHVKNTAAGGSVPSQLPVEILIRTQWAKPTNDVLRGIRDEWYTFRKGTAPVDPTDAQRIGFEVKTTIADRFSSGPDRMPFESFRRRVGDALINGDKDFVTDRATPQVEAAAARTRQLLERIKREGTDVGLFAEAHAEQVAKHEAIVAGLKKAKAAQSEIDAATVRLEVVKKLRDDLLNGGPTVTTARSYRPRIWLVDQLRERRGEFTRIVDDWLRNSPQNRAANLSPAQRAKIADDIWETLTHDKPFYGKQQTKQMFEDLSDTGSAKARSFQIPDVLVKDFLENDVEAIVRSHSRQMGTAIEMHRRFGSTGMEDQVQEIWDEWKLLDNAAPNNEVKKELLKKRDLAMTDLQASRDRLYGVYGAPDDPHRWQSRTIRMAKQFTNLTTLGMSGITALGDLIRPLMTEGLQAVHDYGFRTLASESRSLILKMSRTELELAGDAMELINNTRALSMSDAGDIYHSRSGFERGLAKANSWFFVANGLNFVNQLDKEWAGVIIQGNMNKALRSWAAGGRIEERLLSRFHAAGIDQSMARRMVADMNQTAGAMPGSSRFGKLHLAHTENWGDLEAAKTYRVALNQMVNRTVPTLTLGDTPNFMSTELGSLMTQYKSFAFGAFNRSLVSGLQEDGARYWATAAAAVGFAVVLNEIRSRLFYDRSTFDKPMTGVIMDAVDRSSILGYFSDANRAIEVLTGHRAGVRPLIGAENPREESGSRVIGTFGGPAAGQAANALSVLGDFLAMHPTVKTMADARQMFPGQNIPYLDPAFDHLISDGNRFAKRPKVVNGRDREARQ